MLSYSILKKVDYCNKTTVYIKFCGELSVLCIWRIVISSVYMENVCCFCIEVILNFDANIYGRQFEFWRQIDYMNWSYETKREESVVHID